MWQRLLTIIRKLVPAAPVAVDVKALTQLDPEKIYVENVRSVLDISYKEAEAICETATRQGLFEKGIEVLCPDGSVGAIADTETHLPERVECWFEEEGHLEPREMDTHDLQKVTYYRLNKPSRVAHA